MTTIKTFIKRHPVAIYYAFVFAISWGGILILAGPGGIPGTAAQVQTLFPFMLLVLFAGPSVASILLTGLIDGRAGLRELRARLLRWRVGALVRSRALVCPPLGGSGALCALAALPGVPPRHPQHA